MLFAQLVAQFGSWFQTLTVSLAVISATQSGTALAFVSVCMLAPSLVFGPLIGRLVDRIGGQLGLIIGIAVAGATALALALIWRDPLPLGWIYALLIVSGIASALSRTAAGGLLGALVPRDSINGAAVLFSMVNSVARTFGPGAAGLALLWLGSQGSLVLNAAFGVLALVLALGAREASGARAQRKARGASKVRLGRDIRFLATINVWLYAFGGAMMVMMTSMVTLVLGGGDLEVGLANAFSAVGAVLGGLIVARAKWFGLRPLIAMILVFSVALVVCGASPTLVVFYGGSVLLGIGLGAYQGVMQAAVQQRAPVEARGRAMAVLNMGSFGMVPIASIISGALVDWIGTPAAFYSAAIAAAIAAVAVIVSMVMRNRERRRNGEAEGNAAGGPQGGPEDGPQGGPEHGPQNGPAAPGSV